MYKHSTESIKESLQKRFVSQADKDKYDGYEDRMRLKEDIYTKEQLQEVEKEFTEVKEVNSGYVVSIEDTKEGNIKILNVCGNTVQGTEVINISPYLEDGTIFSDGRVHLGEYISTTPEGETVQDIVTNRPIPVKPGDEIRYFNANVRRNINLHFYDKNDNHIHYQFLGNDPSEFAYAPINAALVRVNQFKRDYEHAKLEITRPRYDLISSLGDEREDGKYDLNLVSCGVNLIDYPQVAEEELVWVNQSNSKRIVCVKLEPNTEYTLSGLYTKNAPAYNSGILVGLYKDIPPATDRWFTTLEKEGKMQIVKKSEQSEFDLTKVFNTDTYKYLAIYVGVATGPEHSHTARIENLMLSKGNKVLPYERYKESRCTIVLDEPLEGLDVGIEDIPVCYDRLINKDGKWIIEKNIRTITFNGDVHEGWALIEGQIEQKNTILFSYYRLKTESKFGILPKSPVMSDKFEYHHTQWNSDKESVKCYTNQDLDVRISKQTASTLDEFRNWLEINNLTVKYAANIPEYIELPEDQQIILNSFAGGTTVRTDNTLQGRVTIEGYKTTQSAIHSSIDSVNDLYNEIERLSKLENIANHIVDTNNFIYLEDTNSGLIDDITISGRTLVNIATVNDISQLGRAGYVSIDDDLERAILAPNRLRWVKKASSSGKTFHPKIILDDKSYGTLIPGKKYTIKYRLKASSAIYHGFVISNGDAYHINNSVNSFLFDVDILRYGVYDQKDSSVTVEVCLTAREAVTKSPYLTIGFGALPTDHSNDEWVEICDLMIVEGDHVNKGLSYFSGMKSVLGDLTLQTINTKKNLCNWTGKTIATAGKSGSDNRFIPFKPTSNKFTIKFMNNGTRVATDRIAFRCLDRYGRILGYSPIRTDNAFITTNPINVNLEYTHYNINYRDVEYLQIFWNSLLTEDITIDEVVAIDGFIDGTEYEALRNIPHDTNKKPLQYLDADGELKSPTLRSVNDTLADTVEKHNDNKYYYHKRCAEEVLNGSEPWTTHAAISNTDEYCYFIVHRDGIKIGFDANEVCVKSEKFTGVSRRLLENSFGNSICINSDSTGKFYYFGIKIFKSLLEDESPESLKKYLSNNPITIIRPCEEQVFECADIELPLYDGGTIVHVQNSLIYPNMKFRVNDNISNVVNNLQDKISVLESDLFEHSVTQNSLLLNSLYSADSTNLKVELSLFSNDFTSSQIEDLELLSLIYKVVIAGKTKYSRDKMEEIIDFYTMIGKLSLDSAEELFDIISSQHDVVIEEI